MTEDLIVQAHSKGSDREFREWVQRQPSCLSGRFSEWLPEQGEWRNPACHVRRAADSGTGFKAEYSCVPMTQREHAHQHQRGEAACLNAFLGCGEFTNDEAKDWFNRQRDRYLRMWLLS